MVKAHFSILFNKTPVIYNSKSQIQKIYTYLLFISQHEKNNNIIKKHGYNKNCIWYVLRPKKLNMYIKKNPSKNTALSIKCK